VTAKVGSMLRAISISTTMGRTSVRDTGGKGPTIVFVHGWGVDSVLNWRSCFEELGDDYRLVAVDVPGHGLSEARLDPTVERMAENLTEVCLGLGIDAPILCGYSMGGAVILESAERCRASGAIFVATAARFARWGGGLVATAGGALRASGFVLRLPAARQENADQPAFLRIAHNDPRALGGALRHTAVYDGRDSARKLSVPATSIITLRDRVVHVKQQLELAELSRARIMEIDAGHDACLAENFPVYIKQAVEGMNNP
jgi:pimeloyl-ACP methyl ester carboxylesterase